MLDPRDFDSARPLIMARADQVNGHRLETGDVIRVTADESGERGELTADQASRLWAAGLLLYSDHALATPVETPEGYAERATEVDELADGKFLIRAPWLGEGEEVSADKLDERRQEIVDLGVKAHRELIDMVGPAGAVAVIAGTDGFAITDNGSGNFEISGPGLDQPLKVRGRANAEDKVAELRLAEAKRVADEAEAAATAQTGAGGGGTAEVVQPTGGAPVSDPAAPPPPPPPPPPPAGDTTTG